MDDVSLEDVSPEDALPNKKELQSNYFHNDFVLKSLLKKFLNRNKRIYIQRSK